MPIRIQITRICHITVLLSLWLPGTANAQTCFAPERPFVPTDPRGVRE